MPRIKVNRALVREYEQRELTDAPYDRITKPGEYEVTTDELTELIADAEYMGDVGGCSGIEIPPQTKGMDRRFYERLTQSI